MSKLKQEQIDILEKNGCTSDSWNKIEVKDNIDLNKIRNVNFLNNVSLGIYSEKILLPENVEINTGIYNTTLNNVVIDDNCYISNVELISNTNIQSNVIIQNSGIIACTKETTFGNGHEIEVLNEGGGRELPITTVTNSQIGYLNVLYRDKNKLINNLNKIAQKYADSVKSNILKIGNNVIIDNTDKIINVNINEYAKILGVKLLEEGTIDSSEKAKTVVTNGVIADNFIFQKGCSVKDGAMI